MAKKIKCDCGVTFEVEEGQTHCKYCGKKLSDIGKKKPVEEKKGRGCLILIGVLIGFFILIGALSSGGEKEKPTATPTPTKTKEEIEAEKQKRQLETEEALDGYINLINSSGMGGYVSKVGVGGLGGGDVEIVVRNIWHYQPKQIRLQAAQTLWEAWAANFCPERETPDSCRITLKDLTGNTVGGSSAWAGSIINVID